MKLIDLHKEWTGTGRIPNAGLCNSVPKKYEDSLEMFMPQEDEIFTFWGSDGIFSRDDPRFWTVEVWGYGILRQTIVLFICAMHDEL